MGEQNYLCDVINILPCLLELAAWLEHAGKVVLQYVVDWHSNGRWSLPHLKTKNKLFLEDCYGRESPVVKCSGAVSQSSLTHLTKLLEIFSYEIHSILLHKLTTCIC